MNVAVVVMHYERNDLTDQVLTQLVGIDDVFVCDDGSTSPYTDWQLHQGVGHHRYVPVFRLAVNLGYVKAVNFAMSMLGARLTYDAVWVLNNDVHGLTPQLLTELTAALDVDPKLAAVSPAVSPTGHVEMKPGLRRSRNPFALKRTRFIDWVCPLVRVTAWQEVGGFDEKLHGFGCDVQFCYDAKLKGWKFGVISQHVVVHDMGATWRAMGKTEHGDIAAMRAYLCKKYNVRRWEDLKK